MVVCYLLIACGLLTAGILGCWFLVVGSWLAVVVIVIIVVAVAVIDVGVVVVVGVVIVVVVGLLI